MEEDHVPQASRKSEQKSHSEPEQEPEQEPEGDFAALIDFHPYRDRFEAYHRIPAEPRSRESILAELGAMAEEEDRMGNAGRVSGSIYHGRCV